MSGEADRRAISGEAGGTASAPASPRRGFPIVPTLMVALALPLLGGLGVWQLQRHTWKQALLADYARNAQQPPADLGSGPIPPGSQFRLVRLLARCPAAPATQRAGRNLLGESGVSHFRACHAGNHRLEINAGWSAHFEPVTFPAFDGPAEGRLVLAPAGDWLLVAASGMPAAAASAPLTPSAPPTPETIPNNHLLYALQWFSFAAILAVIYGLWLRRWLAQRGPAA